MSYNVLFRFILNALLAVGAAAICAKWFKPAEMSYGLAFLCYAVAIVSITLLFLSIQLYHQLRRTRP